jgi:hypothetical protein
MAIGVLLFLSIRNLENCNARGAANIQGRNSGAGTGAKPGTVVVGQSRTQASS